MIIIYKNILQIFVAGYFCIVDILFHSYLFKQVLGMSYAVDHKEYIAYIDRDITAYTWVELDVAHCRAPSAVEVYSNKFALAIDDG